MSASESQTTPLNSDHAQREALELKKRVETANAETRESLLKLTLQIQSLPSEQLEQLSNPSAELIEMFKEKGAAIALLKASAQIALAIKENSGVLSEMITDAQHPHWFTLQSAMLDQERVQDPERYQLLLDQSEAIAILVTAIGEENYKKLADQASTVNAEITKTLETLSTEQEEHPILDLLDNTPSLPLTVAIVMGRFGYEKNALFTPDVWSAYLRLILVEQKLREKKQK